MTKAALELPSFAKINWQLRVIGRRDDGYHDLCTIFQTISLHDTLTFRESNALELVCDSADVPADESNLVLRAANLLQRDYGVASGARIELVKRIPAPGGLGGGSSNAATALIGLARIWGLGLDRRELARLAAELGSDVPFFLYGGTAFGTGRGTEIDPLPDDVAKFMLLVTPDVAVSTADAFKRLGANRLTKDDSKRILEICRKDAGSFRSGQTVLTNDFEASVFAAHPEIGRVKKSLLELGASQALMSGSGASVFAVFDKEETRQATLKALELEISWRKFAVSTVSRDQFRELLGTGAAVVSD